MGLSENLKALEDRIQAACARAGRPRDSVTLLAVSKGQSVQRIEEACALGLGIFGENRVQEAKAKVGLCPDRIRWHLIGHLQSNKCRDAVALFEMVHSVDRMELACELDRWAEKLSRRMPVLLEVNVSGEGTKFGFKPDPLPAELVRINGLARLEVRGLMTMAPWSEEAEKSRPVFRRLRELKEECENELGASLPHLSMGMTGDFEVAIEEGATMIRIGTALFGPRSRPAAKPESATAELGSARESSYGNHD